MTTIPNKTFYFQDGQLVAETTEMVPAPPNWERFIEKMMGSELANALHHEAMKIPGVSLAASSLPGEILNVSKGGDTSLLRRAWLLLLSTGVLPQVFLESVLQEAVDSNLPQHVVEALQPPSS
jgi:hypothetical protein